MLTAILAALLAAASCGLAQGRAQDHESADAALNAGLALAKASNLDEARAALLDAQRRFPRDPRFAVELAGIAYRQKRFARAKHWLSIALRLNPADAYANTFMGTLYFLDGNLPATLKHWNRVDKPLIQNFRYDPAPNLDPLLRDRAFWISGGQILTLKRYRATVANLERLHALSGYQFELTPRDDQRYDLTFHSADGTLPGSRWLRMVPYLRGLPYQTLYFDRGNLERRAIHLHSMLRWDRNKRRLAVSLSGPVRRSPVFLYRVGVDARDETWDLTETYAARTGGIDGLKLRKVEAGGELTYALSPRIDWTSGLWLAHRGYRNADDTVLFRPGWSYQWRNRLSGRLWSWPENRVNVEAFGLLRVGRLFSSPPIPITGVQAAATGTWMPHAEGDDLVVSSKISVGKMFGDVPFDDLFMLGMERDTGLWMRGHSGARHGRKGTAPIGSRYILLQNGFDRTILRHTLFRLQLGPFVDTGRVSDSSGNFGPSKWLVDIGAQAKVKTLGGFTVTFVYGRDLRGGHGVFYTNVSR